MSQEITPLQLKEELPRASVLTHPDLSVTKFATLSPADHGAGRPHDLDATPAVVLPRARPQRRGISLRSLCRLAAT